MKIAGFFRAVTGIGQPRLKMRAEMREAQDLAEAATNLRLASESLILNIRLMRPNLERIATSLSANHLEGK